MLIPSIIFELPHINYYKNTGPGSFQNIVFFFLRMYLPYCLQVFFGMLLLLFNRRIGHFVAKRLPNNV